MQKSLNPGKIKHASIFETDRAAAFYAKKDGTNVKYVCTTDLMASDLPVDVFYRDTPHPEFGNRYFGLYKNPYSDDAQIIITNADIVETYDFGMIEDKDGNFWYSQSHHDCLMIDGKMIDGGRQYVRGTPDLVVYRISNGEFFEQTADHDEDGALWLGADSGCEDFSY